MQTEKRKHSAEFKENILREHLEQQVPIRKLSRILNYKKRLADESIKKNSLIKLI